MHNWNYGYARIARSPRHHAAFANGGALSASMIRPSADRPTSVGSTPAVLTEWLAGWKDLDAERHAAAYTADGVLVAIPTRETLRGRAAIQANLAELFSAFSDAETAVSSVLVSGDRAVVEWTFQGRYTGQLVGLPQGEGQAVALRGVSVLELTDTGIRRNTRYFDLFSLLMQAGAIPESAMPDRPELVT